MRVSARLRGWGEPGEVSRNSGQRFDADQQVARMRDERVMRGAIAVAFDTGLFGERDLVGVELDERTACIRGSARIIDTISSSCARSMPDSD